MGKTLFVIATLAFALPSFAQNSHTYTPYSYGKPATTYTPAATSTGETGGKHFVSGALGFGAPGNNGVVGTTNGTTRLATFFLSGFIGLGGDYDYMMNNSLSYGGFLRYWTISTTINNVTFKNSAFAIGPDANLYLQTSQVLAYAGGGLSLILAGYTDGTGDLSIPANVGLMGRMGILYRITPNLAAGLETLRLIGLSSSINGTLVEDYMLKVRFGL